MIASTVFWDSIAAVFAIVGFLMTKNTKRKALSTIGVILIVVGFGIGIWSQVNLYVNGTSEEIIKYMFWFGRNSGG